MKPEEKAMWILAEIALAGFAAGIIIGTFTSHLDFLP